MQPGQIQVIPSNATMYPRINAMSPHQSQYSYHPQMQPQWSSKPQPVIFLVCFFPLKCSCFFQ